MKHILFFILTIVLCNACKQKLSENENTEYKLTAHKFLSLIKEDKKDAAKQMFLFYPEDSITTNREIRSIETILKESTVPDVQYFILDTTTIINPDNKHFVIELFRNDNRSASADYLGAITIGLKKGIPGKVYTIDTKLASRHVKF